jgi:hypothetical protein
MRGLLSFGASSASPQKPYCPLPPDPFSPIQAKERGPTFRLGAGRQDRAGHEPARYRDLETFAAKAGQFATTRRQTGTSGASGINNLFRHPAMNRGGVTACALARGGPMSLVAALPPRLAGGPFIAVLAAFVAVIGARGRRLGAMPRARRWPTPAVRLSRSSVRPSVHAPKLVGIVTRTNRASAL